MGPTYSHLCSNRIYSEAQLCVSAKACLSTETLSNRWCFFFDGGFCRREHANVRSLLCGGEGKLGHVFDSCLYSWQVAIALSCGPLTPCAG